MIKLEKTKSELNWHDEFANFLNDVNELATEKYGWNVSGYDFTDKEILEIILCPAIGMDSKNRKF